MLKLFTSGEFVDSLSEIFLLVFSLFFCLRATSFDQNHTCVIVSINSTFQLDKSL